jgi:hypothetical protein
MSHLRLKLVPRPTGTQKLLRIGMLSPPPALVQRFFKNNFRGPFRYHRRKVSSNPPRLYYKPHMIVIQPNRVVCHNSHTNDDIFRVSRSGFHPNDFHCHICRPVKFSKIWSSNSYARIGFNCIIAVNSNLRPFRTMSSASKNPYNSVQFGIRPTLQTIWFECFGCLI